MGSREGSRLSTVDSSLTGLRVSSSDRVLRQMMHRCCQCVLYCWPTSFLRVGISVSRPNVCAAVSDAAWRSEG